jgi:hypothetical protein
LPSRPRSASETARRSSAVFPSPAIRNLRRCPASKVPHILYQHFSDLRIDNGTGKSLFSSVDYGSELRTVADPNDGKLRSHNASVLDTALQNG